VSVGQGGQGMCASVPQGDNVFLDSTCLLRGLAEAEAVSWQSLCQPLPVSASLYILAAYAPPWLTGHRKTAPW